MQPRMNRALSLALAMALLAGCGQTAPQAEPAEAAAYVDTVVVEEVIIEDEAVALAEVPPVAAVPETLKAEASGKLEARNAKAVIDYSNAADGYVMVQYAAKTDKRIKAQVSGPSTTYTYNVTAGEWTVFPLSDGNGSYKITVFEHVSDNKYAVALTVSSNVTLKDEFGPFLYANQYVDYEGSTKTLEKARELIGTETDNLKKVKVVYEYVVKNLTYDKEKAATVKSGYLPVLDTVLEQQKGICFDYAALMTGMLRSQGVPCKLVVGYAGTAYHAWISVWTQETGWVDGAIYFDGAAWHRMDPTYASSGKQSASIMEYIGNGSNYTVKYLY